MATRAQTTAKAKAKAPPKAPASNVINLPRTYTLSEIAEVFRVHPVTIRKMIGDGRIAAISVGSRRVVTQTEFDRMMKEGVK